MFVSGPGHAEVARLADVKVDACIGLHGLGPVELLVRAKGAVSAAFPIAEASMRHTRVARIRAHRRLCVLMTNYVFGPASVIPDQGRLRGERRAAIEAED